MEFHFVLCLLHLHFFSPPGAADQRRASIRLYQSFTSWTKSGFPLEQTYKAEALKRE